MRVHLVISNVISLTQTLVTKGSLYSLFFVFDDLGIIKSDVTNLLYQIKM